MVGLGVQEHLSSCNVLWALVSSAGVMGGSAVPQSWLQQWGKKGCKRPTKSSSLTHVHISLEGGLRAPMTLVSGVAGLGRTCLWWAE